MCDVLRSTLGLLGVEVQTANGDVVHLVERGGALPALPQIRGLQALEDSRERTAGPVSPRAGVTARPRYAATYTDTYSTVNTIAKRKKQDWCSRHINRRVLTSSDGIK